MKLAGYTKLALALALACQSPPPLDLLNGPEALGPDGELNVVVEIPAGTNAKWEVRKDDGTLEWEQRDGRPRVVRYLPYPGNYGMVPRSLLPHEEGGDGDPLDVIVLGPARERGSVIGVVPIGVLRLFDGGERDDKILAVLSDGPLGEVRTLDDLGKHFPGVSSIVQTWFANYKGPGRIETRGFSDADVARSIIDRAVRAYAERRR